MSDDLAKRYRQMQEAIGGCSDGYCVIKKPSGMHTNGGCMCLMNLKLHEASRVGQLLRYAQQMADRIEELEAKLDLSEGALDVASKSWGECQRILEQTEAKLSKNETLLAKAVEALGNVVGEYDLFRKDEYERGLSPLDDEIHDARTTLAELRGETDA